MSARFLSGTLALSVLALALTASLAPAVASVTYLWPNGLPANPYWVPERGLLLYLITPLFASAAVTTLLAPGVFLVLATSGAQESRWASVMSRGFLAAYAARVLLHSAGKLVGVPLSPASFWSFEAVLWLVAVTLLVARWRRGSVRLPSGPARRLALLWVLPALVTLLLLPQLFWQDFTEDGLEALEIGRSLSQFVVPRYPADGQFMGLGVGSLAMAPPISWFIQLLGPTEAAARLPLLLYLPVVGLTIVGLAEHGMQRPTSRSGWTMILLVLTGYVAVMAFSATYDRYAADVSAPAAYETLTLLCLSGAVLALWEDRRGWFLGFIFLGYLARPTALLLVLLLGAATLAALQGAERRRVLKDLALALALCFAVAFLYERVYLRWATGGAFDNGSESVLSRYRFLRFADFRRFLWVMLPGGIVPFLALFAWKRQDPLSRQLSLVLLAYFLAFYLPAFVALHHFVPVMVLPVVVLLRSLTDRPRSLARWGVVGCIVGAALSMPWHFHVDQSSRALGSRFAFEVGRYGGSWDEHRAALRSRLAVFELFPPTWDVADASSERVGASLPFLYYSTRSGTTRADADYAVLAQEAPVPEGFFEVGRARGAIAYARSRTTWQSDLADAPPAAFGNPLFVLGPETLFAFIGAPAGVHDLNLGGLPVIWRLF